MILVEILAGTLLGWGFAELLKYAVKLRAASRDKGNDTKPRPEEAPCPEPDTNNSGGQSTT